jgi:hypothetical protein
MRPSLSVPPSLSCRPSASRDSRERTSGEEAVGVRVRACSHSAWTRGVKDLLQEHRSNPSDHRPVRKGGEGNSDRNAGEGVHLQLSILPD